MSAKSLFRKRSQFRYSRIRTEASRHVMLLIIFNSALRLTDLCQSFVSYLSQSCIISENVRFIPVLDCAILTTQLTCIQRSLDVLDATVDSSDYSTECNNYCFICFQVEQKLKCIQLDGSTIIKIGEVFLKELELGIRDKPSSLQMENTYIPELPDGSGEWKRLSQ